ncbi:peptidoglycan-binding protein [Oceanobacillus halophilus]|nr:peptidoglycan-binding protein [Oceanobacillus halophilus]
MQQLFVNHSIEEKHHKIVVTLYIDKRYGYEEFGEEFLAKGKKWILENEARKYVSTHLPNVKGGIVKIAFGTMILAALPIHTSVSAEEANNIPNDVIIYTVQPGDTLTHIASEYKLNIDELKQINGLTSDAIYANQDLIIPTDNPVIPEQPTIETNPEDTSLPEIEVKQEIAKESIDNDMGSYTVKPGDTLTSISNKFDVDINQMKAANDLTADTIFINQVLKIPGKDEQGTTRVEETKDQSSTVILAPGTSNPDVKKMKLNLAKLGFIVSNNPNNDFGPKTESTVKDFQAAYGLQPTGVADAETLSKLDALSSASIVLANGVSHPDVKQLKLDLARLGYIVSNNPNNDYGPKTESTVKEFQSANGLKTTGVADTKTLNKIEELLTTSTVFANGDSHPDVKKLKLNLAKLGFIVSNNPNNDFGPKTESTVKDFQSAYGLKATGVADANTINKVEELLASSTVLSNGVSHPDVKQLKLKLAKLGFTVSNNPNNDYGPKTESTVKDFQSAYGLHPTGVADAITLNKLDELLTGTTVLANGISHPDVKQMKINLAKLGFIVSNNPNNDFGPKTEEQVKKFQRKYGLSVTGIADAKTLDTLEKIVKGEHGDSNEEETILLKEGVKHKKVIQLKLDLEKAGFKVSDNPNTSYGPITTHTVKEFQRAYNLTADGIAGEATLKKLEEVISQTIPSPFNRVMKQEDSGNDVKLLQTYLNDVGFKVVNVPTNYYGTLTENKVKEFQQQNGLPITGIADARTLQQLVTARAGIKENINSFFITGRGYGHAVGMTQHGAYGMASEGYAYDEILSYYYTGTGIGVRDTSNQNIRVLLAEGLDKLTISSNQAYQVGDREFLPNTKTTIIYKDGKYTLENSGRTYELTKAFQVSSSNDGLLIFNNKYYEGNFSVSTSKDKLDLVNHLNIENYLKGVVPYEIIPSWNNLDLFKVQTLAARTYALKQINPNKKFDVYDTTRSQVYNGIPQAIPEQYVRNINQAISATKGEVILYNGALIDAVYSASAGGQTVDAVDVWGNNVPYLIGKEDPYDRSKYASNWWSYTITKQQLQSLYPEVGKIINVTVTETKYNRPTKIRISGETKEITVTGSEFRNKLGTNHMQSATFTIEGIQ